MPRFRDTSLQCSKPSVPRKQRIRNPRDIRRSVDPAVLEMLDYLLEKRRKGQDSAAAGPESHQGGVT